MKTFKDLEFKPKQIHPDFKEKAAQAKMEFDNGYGVSVLLGSMYYSNGIDTYELAVLADGKICYDTPITEDVLGYLTNEEVTEAMMKVQNLPSRKKLDNCTKEKILEKLRKLMNLKESATELGNEGEANAAAAGITRLLIAYNLSESDIPLQEKIDNPVIMEVIPYKPEHVSGNWYNLLVNVVSTNNMCKGFVYSTRKENGRLSRDEFHIIGRKKNVEVVLYLISFLSNKFYQIGRRRYSAYKAECISQLIIPKTIGMYLRSFLHGCVVGLNDKFYMEKVELSKENDIKSLIVSTNAEIEEFIKDMTITKGRASKASVDTAIMNDGKEVGRNVEINKGIYATSVGEERMLSAK